MLAALGACGSAAGGRTPGASGAEARRRPDEAALAIPTLVRAAHARLLVSDRWRGEARLEAIHVERSAGDVEIGRGSAVFVLAELRVEAQELEVKWMKDYEDFLLYATRVARFEQQRGRLSSTQDVSALSLANDKVSILQ